MELEQLLKQQAADEVLAYVESGLIVGLGHGSAAILAVRGLAGKLSRGELTDIKGIPCSRAIEAEAGRLGIPLTALEEHPAIDLPFSLLASIAAEVTKTYLRARARRIEFARSVQMELA